MKASRIVLPSLLVSLLCACAAPGMRAESDGRFDGPRRFALTPLKEMTPEQRAVADAIMKGPRAAQYEWFARHRLAMAAGLSPASRAWPT